MNTGITETMQARKWG